MKRRAFIHNTVAAGAGLATLGDSAKVLARAEPTGGRAGGLPVAQQSVAYWCYNKYPLAELLPQLRELGLSNIDLTTPSQWDLLRDEGFFASMCYPAEENDITTGFIDADLHDGLIETYTTGIKKMSEYGFKNVICFAGNRRGRYDMDGIRVASRGLKRLLPVAEEYDVTIQLELFNSKVDHPDYMADSSSWGITLCDMLGSDNFKLLYDIYHMQVQEGNIVQTIRNYHQYFGHYHTAGVPGRHELGEDQELRYAAVMRALVELDYKGFVAHEFITTLDGLEGLRQAIDICK